MDYGAIGNGITDDSQVCALENGTATLKVPPEKTFMLKPLKFIGPCGFSSVHFQLEGNIVAPNSTKEWTGLNPNRWIDFANINGLIIDGGGQIDGRGSVWWSPCKVKICQRPTALFIHNCPKLQLSGTRHLNSARNHISINLSNDINIVNITITAPQDSPNTDGIDITKSSYILIQNSTIATGDDCIAMNNGTSNVNITDVTCGPGHGIRYRYIFIMEFLNAKISLSLTLFLAPVLSVGSLGAKKAYETVEHVRVHNCNFKEAKNGMRIKTWPGGSGYARDISFEHIVLTNTKNPIIINQGYKDVENDDDKIEESYVEVSDVTYGDINGTCADQIAINFNCGGGEGCTGIIMQEINITSTLSGKTLRASCNNAHGSATSTLPPVSCLLN
ncbi:putative polygalacturonase, partial [Mucuna pruriens]